MSSGALEADVIGAGIENRAVQRNLKSRLNCRAVFVILSGLVISANLQLVTNHQACHRLVNET